MFQRLLDRVLKSGQDIVNAPLANKNSNRNRKKDGKEAEVKKVLKQWLIKVKEKYVRVTRHFAR